jgi:hypothetical protein
LDIAAAAQVVSIVSAAGWPTWFYIYSFFAGAFFALAVADLVFDGLAFDCAFLAADFDFWTFVSPPLSLADFRPCRIRELASLIKLYLHYSNTGYHHF